MGEYPGALWRWQKPVVDRVPLLRGWLSAPASHRTGTGGQNRRRRDTVVVHHLPGLRAGVPGLYRAGGLYRRHAPLPSARGRPHPSTLAQALRSTERQGNPWGQPRHKRAEWAAGLDVPVMADVSQADVLYWVGCAGSYDPRSQKVSRAVVQIMRAAGVDFAILGEEESCNAEWPGAPATSTCTRPRPRPTSRR